MAFVPTESQQIPTLQEMITLGVLGLARLKLYDDTGNPAYLAHSSDYNGRDFQAWQGACLLRLAMETAAYGAQTVVTLDRQEYRVEYAELGTDKTMVVFANHSVSPLPFVKEQIRLYKNGKKLTMDTEWTFSSTAIILSTAVAAGEYLSFEVMSMDEANATKEYWYSGDVGTGVANRTWTLANLSTDDLGNTISAYPSTPSRLKIFLNGLKVTSAGSSPDYSIAGTGTATVVTFNLDLSADDVVNFEIRGV